MKLLILLLLLSFISTEVIAQESNGGKKLYAKSILNQKAPELLAEEWLTEKPETEGKFVLIDFSSTWCHGCRKSMPELNSYQKEFADKLVIIFITTETAEKVRTAKSMLIETPIAIDTKGRTSKFLEIKGIPHNILIDPMGYVRWEGFPLSKDFELTEEVLANLFEKYRSFATDITKANKPIKCLTEQSINGDVKSLVETDFAAIEKSGEVQKGSRQSKKISLFNERGNQIEESFYNSGDTLISKSVNKYDPKGQLIERLAYNQDGKLSYKSMLKYDTRGNMIEEETFDLSGSFESITTNKYDSKDKLLEEKLFNKKDSLSYRSEYKYNTQGNLTEKAIYGKNGVLSSKYSAIYDQKGNKVEEIIYSSLGSVLTKFIHYYDVKGNIIEENVFGPDGNLSSKYIYGYDSNGNQTEESVYRSDGSLVIKYVYGYNSIGNLIEVSRYDPDGSLYLQSSLIKEDKGTQIVWDYYNQGSLGTKYVSKYDNYDKMGNWSRRVKIENQRSATYTDREIKYY